ncbi:MAG: hypothetical protein WBC33_10040 [Conexibacter sp.]
MKDDAIGDDRSAEERALLESALDFYGAAEAVIDYAGAERPRLRYDVERLQDVRDAMATLEGRILTAYDAGVDAEQIARITRLEPEIVTLIVARRRTPLRDVADG